MRSNRKPRFWAFRASPITRRPPRPALADRPQPLETVIPQLVHVLDGMLITAHPRSQVNVVAPPSIASVIGVVLPSMYNPNLCSDESGRGFSEAEVRVASIAARLVGYDPQTAGGVFTFGGTGTLLYGVENRSGEGAAGNARARRVAAGGHSVLAAEPLCVRHASPAGWASARTT